LLDLGEFRGFDYYDGVVFDGVGMLIVPPGPKGCTQERSERYAIR
jgi:hypothetical protein